MSFKKWIKYLLYGKCPGFSGCFPYYGVRVHFSKGSLSFKSACEQGIFEADNVAVLQALVQPDSIMFDVGANIGLMAIPVLKYEPTCKVISFEPSVNTLPSLRKTIANSPFGNRWTLVEKALGESSGLISFSLASESNSLFDGIRPTQRVGIVNQIQVEMTTLDEVWSSSGQPKVSLIKVDVEGAESQVLKGSVNCIQKERPHILIEWNRLNLEAYECPATFILEFAKTQNYQILSVPGFQSVTNGNQLKLQMAFTENFVLSPL